MKVLNLFTNTGSLRISTNVIKGYELNKEGLPMNVFFSSGMSWPISPDEHNLKQLQSL